MLIHSIKLNNILSFGESVEAIPLGPLNVIIGPNGSGKSNLIECINLLKNAPGELSKPIREGGGVRNWLWKGSQETPSASLEVVVDYPKGPQDLKYTLFFTEVSQRFDILGEQVLPNNEDLGNSAPFLYFHVNNVFPPIMRGDNPNLELKPAEWNSTKSAFAQVKDPQYYPEITYLGKNLEKIHLYREWNFGRRTPARMPQPADMRNEYLEPDCGNLGLVLNHLRGYPDVKKRLLEALRALYDGIEDYDVQIVGGTVQVFFQEAGFTVPATRLSDGTLRYLCLLAILCHPDPPPLICIEEPELGLHPDILPTLADLLKEASERTQLIVTTHSDILVDAMTDRPEAILICEKDQEGTRMRRLSSDELEPWLKDYRLGELWTRGDLGGTRW